MKAQIVLFCCVWAMALGRPSEYVDDLYRSGATPVAVQKKPVHGTGLKNSGIYGASSAGGFETPSAGGGGGYYSGSTGTSSSSGIQNPSVPVYDGADNGGYNFGGGILYAGLPSPGQHRAEDSTFHGTPNAHNFGYQVEDTELGNQHGHSGYSDGDTTKGEYRVLLPDGRTQIVTYSADPKHGFMARVTYEGKAKPYRPKQQQQTQQQGIQYQ